MLFRSHVCIFFVTYEHPLYRFIFLHRGRFVYCPFLLVRFIQGPAFCICDREEHGRVTQVSIREIRFPNTHIRLAFRGFAWLFICGRAPRWLDILPPFGSRYRMIREGLLGGKFAIGHSFKIRITTSVLSIAGSI